MKNVKIKRLESTQPGIFQDRRGFGERGHLQLNKILPPTH